MRLRESKVAMPAEVKRTSEPTAISIITTSTIARCSFTAVSLPAVGKGKVLRLGSVTSTQDVARDLPIGSVVVAEHQTAGRGRLDRRWEAPPGTALLVSFVLPRNSLLSLAAGVAAAEACGNDVRLKWPNDLLLEGRKLGGILVEMTADKAICGIGVNLTSAPDGAAQLDQPRDELLARLQKSMAAWTVAPPDQVLARWRDLSATLGRRVRVDVGHKSTEGLAEDLGPNGELIVDGFPFVAGSVTHL
jgi:BirA family transcriptional regulator, biotin operon repressor / biotin---[acetyl-CoA-carboxylase] ligase